MTKTTKKTVTVAKPKVAKDVALSIRVGGKFMTRENVSTATLAKLAGVPDAVVPTQPKGKDAKITKVSQSVKSKPTTLPVPKTNHKVVTKPTADKTPVKVATKQPAKPAQAAKVEHKLSVKSVAKLVTKTPSKKLPPVFDTKVVARKDKPQAKTKDMVQKMHNEITRVFS